MVSCWSASSASRARSTLAARIWWASSTACRWWSELKKPGVPARAAFHENLTHYKAEIPQLFWFNALLIASNGTDSRVGSLTADWERFFEWKRIEREDEPRRVSLEVMIRGTCDQTRLLDLVENFTLFSEHKAWLVKIIEELFEELLKLSRTLTEEQQRHVRENMTEEELVIFDILTRPAPELSSEERVEVKKVARELLNRLRQLLVLNWRQKSSARSQLRLTIEDVLDAGLPRIYDKPLYEQKCLALFEHIYESYPERDLNDYVTSELEP
jgi:type I site-specific restriction-modification system R (restriction) subunit